RREFLEETGQPPERCGAGELIPLGSIRQPGGKIVEAWGFEGDWPEGETLASNTFELEWPPQSGRMQTFPEVDEGRFFPESEARPPGRPRPSRPSRWPKRIAPSTRSRP